jgi:hypothetical protein
MICALPSFPIVETPPSEAWILRLPNEILNHILSFLTGVEPSLLVTYPVNGGYIWTSQELVLRSVCRLFRTVTTELDFWCHASFSFMYLIYPSVAHRNPPTERDLERFYRVLFSDAHLVESLSRRKTDWVFRTVRELDIIKECIPSFTRIARGVHLMFYSSLAKQSLFDIAFAKLAVCLGVTKLSTNFACVVNLSIVAASFPLLEEIHLHRADYIGSLRSLNSLRKLHLDSTWRTESTILWLPVNCTETMTELELVYQPDREQPVFDFTTLETYTNLKSLSIKPLCESVCDYIINSRVHLDVFSTDIRENLVSINKFRDVLQAESLRNLKEFKLKNSNPYYDEPGLEQYFLTIFEIFTSNLCSVEVIHLNMPLHLQCCKHFAKMRNLKILNWDCIGARLSFGFGRRKPGPQMEKALDAAFGDFEVKPKYTLRI